MTKQMDDVLEFLRSFIAGGVNQDFKPWANELYQKLYHSPVESRAGDACPFCGERWRYTNPSGSCGGCGAPEDLANERNHIILPPWDEIAALVREARMRRTQKSSERQITTVTGIECMGFQGRHPSGLDSDNRLSKCPFCGSIAAVRLKDKTGHDAFRMSVECVNTSCGVKIPEHYATREAAIEAWNRRSPPNLR